MLESIEVDRVITGFAGGWYGSFPLLIKMRSFSSLEIRGCLQKLEIRN